MPDIWKNMSPVVVDKAASYTVVPEDLGKVFVSTAAATFTLPPVADVWNGWNAYFVCGANTNLVVSAPAGKLVTFNDIAANSVAFSTTSEKVGGAFEMVYDLALTKYLVFVHAPGVAQTVTYTT